MNMERASIAGLVLTVAIAVIAVVRLSGQAGSPVTGDFRNATVVEVKDAQGQTLLTGNFVAADADKGEVERLAKLQPVTAGATLSGEAEVEYQTDSPETQEVELSARGLTAGAQVTLVIDGNAVTTATADSKGRVSVELEVRVR
jgi:hypothetical protein